MHTFYIYFMPKTRSESVENCHFYRHHTDNIPTLRSVPRSDLSETKRSTIDENPVDIVLLLGVLLVLVYQLFPQLSFA